MRWLDRREWSPALNSIENDGSCGDPYQHENPYTTNEKVIVVKQACPRMTHHEMTEKELKADSQDKPSQTKLKGFMC